MPLKYQLFPKTSYFITYHLTPTTSISLDHKAKQILLEQIQKTSTKNKTRIDCFAIINNHFHLIATSKNDHLTKNLLSEIAGGSAFQINKHLHRKGKLWGKYYCWGIFTEKAYNNISAYILGNPIRHGIVKTFDELYNYPFCSFKEHSDKYGRIAIKERILSILKIKTNETREDFYKSLE